MDDPTAPAAAAQMVDTDLELAARRGSPLRGRLLALGLVLALVVAGVTALVVTDSGTGSATTKRTPGTAASIAALLHGIPQVGELLGYPSARLRLVYFGDLECPYCREFTLGSLPTIIRRWVQTGKLQIAYLSMETATREPKVFVQQQVAALAAGRQNKMWYFIELFYHEQGEEDSGYVTEHYLQGLAQQVPGLNLPEWMSDRNEPALARQVLSTVKLARRLKLRGTPSLIFEPEGARPVKYNPQSLSNPKGFDEFIEKLLTKIDTGL